ncbi:MAG TPA: hypothetical protein VHW45_20235 [Candidatus Sulfotelmatobacter sp.]|nr:hypothetical protein [Candidatus Sulfotelmatobacter sp.]
MPISLQEWLAKNDYASADEALTEYGMLESIYPALCSDGCEVEPDGHCPHGGPSLLLALGLI